jgi:hypothetical protein
LGRPGLIAVGILYVLDSLVIVIAWSRRTGWDQRHVLAAWSAGLLTAAASAYLSSRRTNRRPH